MNYTLYTEAKVTDSIFKDMSSTRSFWKPQPPPVDLVKGNDASQEAEMVLPEAVAQEKNSPAPNGETTASTRETRPSGTGTLAPEKIPAVLGLEQPVVQADIIKINENFKKRKKGFSL